MSAATGAAMVRIGVSGQGASLAAWERALRACEGVEVRRLPAAPDDLLTNLGSDDLDAIAFASPPRELAAMAKRAILARKHALLVPGIADSQQLILLDELARRRQRVLLINGCGFADETMDVARRMTRGDHPMRRPRYLRALRVCDEAFFEDAALGALSRILAIAGEQPSHVSAVVPRLADEDDGDARVTAITLAFPSGLGAYLHVSSLEPEERDELTIVCNGRTLVLDGLSRLAPLRVLTAVRSRPADKIMEHFANRAEQQAAPASSAVESVAVSFVEAVRAGDPVCNAREFAASALVWETARTSMARGGDFTPLPANHPLVATSRPSLHVIEGGGNTTDTTAAPRLRLVQGGRRAEPLAPPPRSA